MTLPVSVRQKAGVAVGDILEAVAEGNKITLRPKSVIDRELALALADAPPAVRRALDRKRSNTLSY